MCGRVCCVCVRVDLNLYDLGVVSAADVDEDVQLCADGAF